MAATPLIWSAGAAGLVLTAGAAWRWGVRGALSVYFGGLVLAVCLWPFLAIAGHLLGVDPGRMAQFRATAPAAAIGVGGIWGLCALPVVALSVLRRAVVGRRSP